MKNKRILIPKKYLVVVYNNNVEDQIFEFYNRTSADEFRVKLGKKRTSLYYFMNGVLSDNEYHDSNCVIIPKEEFEQGFISIKTIKSAIDKPELLKSLIESVENNKE